MFLTIALLVGFGYIGWKAAGNAKDKQQKNVVHHGPSNTENIDID